MIVKVNTAGTMRYYRPGDDETDDDRLDTEEYIGPRMPMPDKIKVVAIPFGVKLGKDTTSEPEIVFYVETEGDANTIVEALGPSFKHVFAYGNEKRRVVMHRETDRGIFYKFKKSVGLAEAHNRSGKFSISELVASTDFICEYVTKRVDTPCKEVVLGDSGISLPIMLKSASYKVVEILGPFYDGRVYSRAYTQQFTVDSEDLYEITMPKVTEEKSTEDRLQALESSVDKILEILTRGLPNEI